MRCSVLVVPGRGCVRPPSRRRAASVGVWGLCGCWLDPAGHALGAATAAARNARRVAEGNAGEVDVDVHRALSGSGPDHIDDPAVERVPALRGELLGLVLHGLRDSERDPSHRVLLGLSVLTLVRRGTRGGGRGRWHWRNGRDWRGGYVDHELWLTAAQSHVDRSVRQ